MEAERIIKINIYMILISAAINIFIAYTLLGVLFMLVVLFRKTKSVIWGIKSDKSLILLLSLVFFTSIMSEFWFVSIVFAGIFFIKVIFSQLVLVHLSNEDVRIVLTIFLILGIVVSIIGLIQMGLKNIEMPVSWVDTRIYAVSFRMYSTFSNPNVFAGFLNLIIIIGITVNIYESKKNMRILSILSISISVISLVFTYSRGGWISLCLSLLIASLYEKRFLKYSLGLIILFISFDYFCDIGRLLPDNILMDSSIRYRFEIWIASVKILIENLLFGIGSGTSWYYLHQHSDVISTTVSHTHNLYLQSLIDVGIFGFAAYCAFYWGIWKRISRKTFSYSELGLLNTVSFIFYLSLLLFGLIDVVTYYLQLSIYLWFFIGSNKINEKSEQTICKSSI